MLDQYGRNIDYVRISVTDRCNLRCVYCMPDSGEEQTEHTDILTYEEITRLCRILAEKGIHKVKITGGEPLVRKDIAVLIKMLKELPGIRCVTLTTNGILLKEQMDALAQAGLDAVNISLDALNRGKFKEISKRDHLEKVLESVEYAMTFPNIKVKINCVLLHGFNEDQWVPIAGLARDRDLDVRFIEMMPIGYGRRFYHGKTEDQVRSMLEEAYGKSRPVHGRFGNGPGTYLQFEELKGKIGFISSISHKFCSDCNRIRITSQGFLKPCLQFSYGADLRELLRKGSSDEQIGHLVEELIFRKPRSHRFGEEPEEGMESRKMSEIGG